MKREIKFRGKRVDNGVWAYGYLAEGEDCTYIVYKAYDDDYQSAFDNVFIPVCPETVGQFTGLKDKNVKDIYEGDITKVPVGLQNYANWTVGEEDEINGFIEWNKVQLCWQIGFSHNKHSIVSSSFGYYNSPTIEIIGNIHDNPDLLCPKHQ